MKRMLFILASLALTLGLCAQTNENVFTYQLGDCTLFLLSEGQGEGNAGILIGATEDMIAEAIPEGTFPNATNAFLLKDPEGRYILFDTGHGRRLFSNLDSLRVKPEDIKIICLTHLHGDHIGGMFRDGEKAFPNALIHIAEQELAYWSQEGKEGSTVAKVLREYGDSILSFTPLVLSELSTRENRLYTPIIAPGHTPGHTMFLLEDKGEALLIWADLTHAMAIQMPYPEVAVRYDVDPEQAKQSRLEVLRYISERNIPIAGMHIAYPGMGKVEPVGIDSYRFIPAE